MKFFASSQKRLLKPSIFRRILAVNILALLTLVVGLLYVDRYRISLIESEVGSLSAQAENFAAALGEAATNNKLNNENSLNQGRADQIIRRLAKNTKTQLVLISRDRTILSDSRLLLEPGGLVQIEELPPPETFPNIFTRHLLNIFDKFTFLFFSNLKTLNIAGEIITYPTPDLWSQIDKTFEGQKLFHVDISKGSVDKISVAVPVQRYKQVLGTLILTFNPLAINESVFLVRLQILQISMIALVITIFLSIYLAKTIAQPINRLVKTANNVRQGLSREYSILNLSKRDDEIGELAKALQDMTDSLWARMDLAEQFSADVAHEIKNPLTSIKSAIETAIKIDDANQRKHLMTIVMEDVNRLDRLITDISELSRVDAELSKANFLEVDLSQTLKAFEQLYNQTVGDKGSKLLITLHKPHSFLVMGIEDRLVQVLRNLVENAQSFSPPHDTIRVDVQKIENKVQIIVEDKGPGISPESLDRIFQRFYQDRQNKEEFGNHSGLGLNICEQIVELHNGRIWAENITKKNNQISGARFIVEFPSLE